MKVFRILILSTVFQIGGLFAGEANPAAVSEPQKAKWAQKFWMPRHESIIQEIKKNKGQFDLILIGDSITQGWQGKAARNALAKDFKGKKILNLGFKGDYTGHVLWRLQNGELEGVSAEVAVIMIGTNNTTRGDSSSQTAEGVKLIVEEVKKRLPESKILLISVFPRSAPDHKFRKINTGINEIIQKYADQKSVFWFDMTPNLTVAKGELNAEFFARDQLHIRDKGYEMWSAKMKEEISKILSTK